MVVDRLPRLTLASVLVTPMCPLCGVSAEPPSPTRDMAARALPLWAEGNVRADGTFL